MVVTNILSIPQKAFESIFPSGSSLYGKRLTLYQSINNLDLFKLKSFSDDSFNVAKMVEFVFHKVESIVGKVENACYKHFLLFTQCFPKTSNSGSLKVGTVW